MSASADGGRAPRVARVGTSLSLNLILRNQMRFVAERGYAICCVCEDDEWARELRELGFDVWPLALGRRPGPLAAAAWGSALYRRLRKSPVDIVHTHNAFHGIVGRIVARLAGVPVVVQTVHNWWYLAPGPGPGSRVRAWGYLLLERFAARFSDRLFFLNSDDFEFAAQARVTRPEKRQLIGNGIDTAAFLAEHTRADRGGIREELGLPANGLVVAMVARLEPPKDHETLLQAMRVLSAQRSELRLLLVGYGMHEARIRQRVDDLRLTDRVVFTGYRADVPTILAAADALVLTSRQEGFGRCLVEGMLAEIPVIATDVVGVRDVIADGENGLLIPEDDSGALVAALARVFDDREFTGGLVRRAREQALERFDERLPASRVADAYDELLRAAGQRRRRRVVSASDVDTPARDADERERILDAYAARRARVAAGEIDPLRYTSWTPGYLVSHQLVERRVLQMLRECGIADLASARVLDVGSGDGVIGESEGLHLHELIKYGARPENLHGVDLQEHVVRQGRELHPGLTLTEGSAEALPYEDSCFDLVCQSTVFSSILDEAMRRQVAAEMLRVLRPRGIVLWYDFRRNNPFNRDIRRVTRAEVGSLFPGCTAWFRSSTLAHPIARPLARVSPLAVELLELVRPLRTHDLAIITRDPARLPKRRQR